MKREGGGSYDWIIVSVSFVTLVLICGLWSTFSIFINPIQVEFNRDRSSVSLAMSIGLIVYGASLPIIGRLIDRFGPKKVIIPASLLAGVSTILLSLISRLWHFHLLYGVPLALGYAGAGLIANTSLVRSRFTESSELALSVTQSGLPLGQLIVTLVAANLILKCGWRNAYLIMGLILLLVIPTMVLLLVEDRPVGNNLRPDEAGGDVGGSHFQGNLEAGLSGHIRSPFFLILAAAYFICGFTDIPIATHMAPFISDMGFTEMVAAYILSLIGGATWVGTLLFGFLSQKFERRHLIAAIYSIRAATFFILLYEPHISGLTAFSILFGLTQFSMVPLIAAWMGDRYGNAYLGRLFGFITLIHAVGASSGTYLNGWIFDASGSYRLTFVISSTLAFTASALIYFIKEKQRGNPREGRHHVESA